MGQQGGRQQRRWEQRVTQEQGSGAHQAPDPAERIAAENAALQQGCNRASVGGSHGAAQAAALAPASAARLIVRASGHRQGGWRVGSALVATGGVGTRGV